MKPNLISKAIKTAFIAVSSCGIAGAPLSRGVAAESKNATDVSNSSRAATNQVLVLDGETGFLRVPDSAPLHSISNSITLEASCLARSFYPNRGSVNSILRKNVQAGAENFFLRIRNLDGTRLVELGLGRQPGVLQAPAMLKTNQWYHLAGTYDGSAVTIYLNGVKIKSQPLSGSLTIDSSDLVIGKGDPLYSSGEYFHGMLDEIRIWNRARTPAEIEATMNKTLTGKEAGLVAYWNFDDGSAKDASGYGCNGRLQGNVRISEVALPTIAPAAAESGTAATAVTSSIESGGAPVPDLNK